MTANKKRKLESDPDEDQYAQTIANEIDLEIRLKQRLAQTIESRITWALLLQEAISKESGDAPEAAFKDAAFDALAAIEAPSEFLFTREAPAPPLLLQPPGRKPRPPPKEKPLTRSIRSQKPKFLYLRSQDSSDSETYILKCPSCLRTTFTSLQGLYNHARISHGLEWGNHEECVRACAVLAGDGETDLDAGLEVGAPSMPGVRGLFQMAVEGPQDLGRENDKEDEEEEVGGRILESGGGHLMRTLGIHSDTPALAPFLGKEVKRRQIKVWEEEDVVDITGFEQAIPDHAGDDVEKENPSSLSPSRGTDRKPRWRKPYTHRNVTRTEQSSAVDLSSHRPDSHTPSLDPQALLEDVSSHIPDDPSRFPDLSESGPVVPHPQSASILDDAGDPQRKPDPVTSTRFHIAARIIVTDRSLMIPPECRSQSPKDHTHQWMISVESASYSHDITTILTRLEVASLSDPSAFEPLSATGPPFVVIGTTGQPFLSRVELSFSGVQGSGHSGAQKVVLEHWVELDPMGVTKLPVKGDEQVVDVELDRGTIILPAKTGYPPVTSRSFWDGSRVPNENQDTDFAGKHSNDVGYSRVLGDLLPRFPMTQKDVKGRTPPLPYKLVPAPWQFKALIMGRRKAIEWARAKALRDAYEQTLPTLSPGQADLIPLTTGDVFCWLEDEGYFIRDHKPALPEPTQPKKKLGKEPRADSWCRICGLGMEIHPGATDIVRKPAVKLEGGVLDESLGNFQCDIVPALLQIRKMPILDVRSVLSDPTHGYTQPAPAIPSSTSSDGSTCVVATRRWKYADIITATDSSLTIGVRNVVGLLKLPCFQPDPHNLIRSPMTIYPLDNLGSTQSEVEASIAPHALLALATQKFIRALINGALETSKRDKELGFNVWSEGRVKKTGRWKGKTRLLTPSHILGGVVAGERGWTGNRVGVAVFGCLKRLGVLVGSEPIGVPVYEREGAELVVRPEDEIVTVKLEPEGN